MSVQLDRREFLMGTTGLVLARPAQGRPYVLESTPRGRVLKAGDGRVAYEYLTTKPAELTAESACCFHPLNTPAGERLTDLAPKDHTTHRGVFLAWHAMSFAGPAGPLRADFWGWGRYAPTAGRVITNRGIRLASADTGGATVEIDNDWTIDGTRVLTEQTTAAWRGGGEANVLDLTYRLTPEVEATIEQQAFGGFCARGRNDGKSWFSNAAGTVDLPNSSAANPALNWPAAPWYAYSIARPGGNTIGWAVLDHPDNPASTWHTPRSVHFLQPAIMAGGPVVLPRGRALTLRYRVAAFDGDVPTAVLTRLSEEWRG